MKHACLAAALAILAAQTLLADEIQLTNGRKISGNVTKKDGGKVTIEVGTGTITLDAKEVSSINPGRTTLNEYDERWAKVKDSTKASDYFELAKWADEHKVSRHVVPLCIKVLAIEPEHAGAHAMLRHEKIGGKWLTFGEAQEARGFVFVDDRWMTKAEVELIEKRRLQARERALAVAAEREQRREEEKARRQAAIDDYNRSTDQALSSLDGYFYSPSFAWTTPYFRPYWWAPYVRSRNVFQNGWRYDSGLGWPLIGLRWR
jgi:hypothetical protein